MANPLPFDERIELAGHLTVLARRFYDVWWYYEGADTRPSILDAMNLFPEFFRFDTHAQFVSLVTHLAALYENRNGTINFETLITEAENASLVSESALDEAKATLSSVSALRPKVAILRSNLFSHRSASLSYEAAFAKAEITPFQLRDLTVVGLKIANTLLAARGLPEPFFSNSTLNHTKNLLQALANHARS